MNKKKPVAFLFSGQGSQYPNMGRQMFLEHATYRESMFQMEEIVRANTGRSILSALYLDQSKFDLVLSNMPLAYPAVFMVEYAIAQALISDGVKPDITIGTSMGSFAAAAIAGHMKMKEALTALLLQGYFLEKHCSRGAMIAILGNSSLLEEYHLTELCEIASDNFPGSFAVAAKLEFLEEIQATLKERKTPFQRLPVSLAFHSRWIDAAEEACRHLPYVASGAENKLPMVCCAEGSTLLKLPENFLWHAIRKKIRFAESIQQLEREDEYQYIDVGPGGGLATSLKYLLSPKSKSRPFVILTPFHKDVRNFRAVVSEE